MQGKQTNSWAVVQLFFSCPPSSPSRIEGHYTCRHAPWGQIDRPLWCMHEQLCNTLLVLFSIWHAVPGSSEESLASISSNKNYWFTLDKRCNLILKTVFSKWFSVAVGRLIRCELQEVNTERRVILMLTAHKTPPINPNRRLQMYKQTQQLCLHTTHAIQSKTFT